MQSNPHTPLGAACVYRLTHVKSGRAYIGKTVKTLEERVRRHTYSDSHIGRALRRHGRDAFQVEVLLVGDEEHCFEMERALIEAQGTLAPGGYNVAEGGNGLTIAAALEIAVRHNVGQQPNFRAAARRFTSDREHQRRAAKRAGELRSQRANYPAKRTLEALRGAPDGLTIADLVAQLGLSESSVRNAITALRKSGGHNIVCVPRPTLVRLDE